LLAGPILSDIGEDYRAGAPIDQAARPVEIFEPDLIEIVRVLHGRMEPTSSHWNSGIAVLRNNGLIETEPGSAQSGRRYRAAPLLRG